MEIVMMKTHLIITDQWDDFYVEQYPTYPRLKDLNVDMKKGKPCFVITTQSGRGRVELETFDYNNVIEKAINYTFPRGRGSITKDFAYVWIKTTDRGEVQICRIKHIHNRKYAPMYDPVEIY